LPIIKREGLFLAGFVPNAWRDWNPPEKKTTPQKLLDGSGRKCSFTPEAPAESAGTATAETADYESCCHVVVEKAYGPRVSRLRKPLTSPLAIRLSLTADRGHLRLVA
jgi:hypothetical protein